ERDRTEAWGARRVAVQQSRGGAERSERRDVLRALADHQLIKREGRSGIDIAARSRRRRPSPIASPEGRARRAGPAVEIADREIAADLRRKTDAARDLAERIIAGLRHHGAH